MVQSRVEDLSPVVKRISVELAAADVKKEFESAVTKLSRTVRLKGYRAGHAPRRLVERHFSDDLKRDVANKLVNNTIFEALEQHKLEPIAQPRVENGEVDVAAPFKYVATIEVRPVVDPKDYEGLAAPKADAEVTDKELEERLEEMRSEQSVFQAVEGRDVVEQSDFATVDYEGFMDGQPLRGAKREGVLLEMSPGSLLENKAESLVGAKVGELRELGVTFPADYAAEDLRGKEAMFKATIKGMKRRKTPELDDAFAKDLGFDSLDLLKEQVKKDLAAHKKEKLETAQREALLNALLEKNPIEAPPAMVERNVDAMLRGMLEGFERRGLDVSQLGVNIESLRDNLRDRAQTEVKAYLVLDAIGEKEKLEVSEDDLEKHYVKLATEAGQTPDKIKQLFKRPDSLASLKSRMKQDKAYDLILAKANLS